MADGGGGDSVQPTGRATFGVYQNASISSALESPPPPVLVSRAFAAAVCLFLTWFMLAMSLRKGTISTTMKLFALNYYFANTVVKVIQGVLTVIFLGALAALCKVLSSPDLISTPNSKLSCSLTERQQVLLGRWSPKPRSRKSSASPASSPGTMVPLHPPMQKGSKATPAAERRTLLDPANNSGAFLNSSSPATPVQISTFPYSSSPSIGHHSPPQEPSFSPWATKYKQDEIRNEDELESFLAEVDSKMVDSVGKSATQSYITPPPTIRSVAVTTTTSTTTGTSPGMGATPQTISSSRVNTLRVSPSPQKSGVSPKKIEDLPAPFTMEQTVDCLKKLGVYPEIEQWRDGLRQWFSKVLLGPLVEKIDRSHIQVMEAAAKLGCTISVAPIGGAQQDNTTGASAASGFDGTSQEWVTPDEDAFLHQFRAALLNAKNAPPQTSMFGLRPEQPPPVNPLILECLDAVTEHQRLCALVKGEWSKGLLPQSSVRADYTVQRLHELAEGTCVKKYEFTGTGEVYDKSKKKWRLELPTDAHLLVYLFCALLEHPQWMLHVDPTAHQSANNPLFIANLPHKERFPDRYIALLSTAPPVLHTGACVLAVSHHTPPLFALYWDKRLQFCLQGRTALWDAILLLCYRIKVAHGGMVRGINLGGSAFNLLSILEEQ